MSLRSETSPDEPPLKGLRSRSFAGLVVLQFFTVLNDNTYRWLVVPIGYVVLGREHHGLTLTLGLVCYVVPYVLLMTPAAYLADRYSKRTVMSGCMILQAVIVVLGTGSIAKTNAPLTFTTLALMGAQGALMSPAKGGTVPETVRPDRISAANGVLGMTMVMAALVGTVLGNTLYVLTRPLGTTHLWISFLTMLAISVLGFLATLLVDKHPAADPQRPIPSRLFAQTARDLRALTSDRTLLAVALCSAYLWFLAALAQVNVYLLGTTTLHITQEEVGPLLGALAGGVAAGSVLAGLWSAGKIEPGIVPVGAAGIALSALVLSILPGWTQGSEQAYVWSLVGLFLMGVSAGLYDVPLRSYLQYNSPKATRGQVLAAANFLEFSWMLLAAGLFWIMRSVLRFSAETIFLAAAVWTLPVFLAVLYYVWRQTLDVLLRPLEGLKDLIPHHRQENHKKL